MTHRLFARMVAAGLVVMVAGTAWAQVGEESGATAKLQIPPVAVAVTRANRQAFNRGVAAAEFRSLPPITPAQPPAGVPSGLNSRSNQVMARVAIGLMAAIVGASIAQAAGLQFGR